MKSEEKAFWITNISDRDISLSDLGVTIRAFTSINLMDSKHYPYITTAMLNQSEQAGSLFKRRDRVVHRKIAPMEVATRIPFNREAVIPDRQRSIVEVKQEQYEELNITDDDLISNISNPSQSDK